MHTPATPFARAALLPLLLAGTLTACQGDDGAAAARDDTPADVDGIVIPQPLAYAAFPVDSNTINGWVAAVDTVSIRQHAWEVWAGLTAMTDQVSNGDTLPVYETWLSRYDVFNPGQAATREQLLTRGRRLDRGFHSPVQFHHPGVSRTATAGAAGNERVVAGVKYNNPSVEHVWSHNYVDSATLTALNNSFTADTPVANRNILPFPNSAVATKPVYWIVNQTGLTIMPYWAGADSSSKPSQPTPATWTQFVAVDPTGRQAGQTVQVQENGQTYTAQVVGLDQFYSFALTQSEVNDIVTTDTATGSTPLDPITANSSIDVLMDGAQSQQPVNAGDYGVLVAMHVSTKEIGNWTWQTFWWTPNAATNPLAMDKPASVQGPFRNFAMLQAYYMTVPSGPSAGQDQVAFNPYLETAFPDSGTVSNCMTCHRMASWPTNSYLFAGNINPADPALFGTVTKLDFLWSVQAGASTARTALLRRIRNASQATPPGASRDTQPRGAAPPAAPSGR